MELTCACCGKKYHADKPENDLEVCSYSCWEKLNCQVPEIIPIDEFVFNEN